MKPLKNHELSRIVERRLVSSYKEYAEESLKDLSEDKIEFKVRNFSAKIFFKKHDDGLMQVSNRNSIVGFVATNDSHRYATGTMFASDNAGSPVIDDPLGNVQLDSDPVYWACFEGRREIEFY